MLNIFCLSLAKAVFAILNAYIRVKIAPDVPKCDLEKKNIYINSSMSISFYTFTKFFFFILFLLLFLFYSSLLLLFCSFFLLFLFLIAFTKQSFNLAFSLWEFTHKMMISFDSLVTKIDSECLEMISKFCVIKLKNKLYQYKPWNNETSPTKRIKTFQGTWKANRFQWRNEKKRSNEIPTNQLRS